jgi:hypothetical protein
MGVTDLESNPPGTVPDLDAELHLLCVDHPLDGRRG